MPTPQIEARLGSEFGRLVNVSATGALVRVGAPFQLGRTCPLILNIPESPVSLTVRVVRAEPESVASGERHGRRSEDVDYLIGVKFTEYPSSAKQAIVKLCGTALRWHE